jgi:hypothetical protein
VEAVEHDQENTNTWWESKDPYLREAVCFKLSVFEGPHGILLVLVATIERGEIQIAGGK